MHYRLVHNAVKPKAQVYGQKPFGWVVDESNASIKPNPVFRITHIDINYEIRNTVGKLCS